MKKLLSLIFSRYVVRKNSVWKKKAITVQKKLFFSLLKAAQNTRFGKEHNFINISNYDDWKKNVPIRGYEEIEPYIQKIIAGEKNILWPGLPIYFCKTSGTTSGAKYIPITKESMPNHVRGARDAILHYIDETKNTSIVDGKMIFLQGSPKLSKTGQILTGRLSGIVAHHVPFYLQKNRLPSFEVNCISDWEEKINKIVEETHTQKMTLIGGIPPWVKMYFEKLQAKSGGFIKDIFPEFSLFVYGGVNYSPYKNVFEKMIGKTISSLELYPASEGFIAFQDSQKENGLLLCVDHGIFYEFIPSSDFFKTSYSRVSLSDVVIGVDYVIILNSNAGLWGYNLGDTVKFVSLNPFKIIVTGRISHFTSAFGEHVIAEEIENSLSVAMKKHPSEIIDFHVAPQVNPKKGLPFHEWLIEFSRPPKDISAFAKELDLELQIQNVYYKDLIKGNVLTSLKITTVNKNGFIEYMKSVGKLGGQNKVPRLANNRNIADHLKTSQ